MIMQLINQRDPKYAGWTLGSSSLSVNSYGCAASSAAMALDMDLLTLIDNNDFFTKPGHPQGAGLILWENIHTLKDRESFSEYPADLPKIAGYIHDGYPVILETRFDETESLMHFVLAIGVSDDGRDFLINDPWGGEQVWFSAKYGDPSRWIYQMIVYDKKTIQTEANPEQIPVDKKQFEALVTKSGRFDEVCHYLEIAGEPIDTPFEAIQSVVAGYKARITDLNNQLVAETTERKNREEQVSRLKDQVTSATESSTAIQKKIVEITRVYEGQVKKLQVQVDAMGKDKGKLNETISTLTIEKQKLQNQVDSLAKQAVSGMDAKTLAKYLLKKLTGRG